MNSVVKTVVFWLAISVSAFLLWQSVKSGDSTRAVPEISYSDFLTRVANGQVSAVTITSNAVRVLDTKGNKFRVITPTNQTVMLDALQRRGVDIWFKEAAEQGWPNWLLNLAPLILLGALWFFMIRQMRGRRLPKNGSASYAPPPESKPRFGS